MAEHETKDSGERNRWETGAQRDTENGKPLYHQIPFRLLDNIQQKAGGAPISIDRRYPAIHTPAKEQRHDLIPTLMLERLAALYHRGEVKYGANNWQKGIPLVRIFGSLLRHAFQWFWGDTSEDHLAAVIWNATALMWTEAEISAGRLPNALDDREFAWTRVVFSYNTDEKRREMDLVGWLNLAEATKKCQEYWSIPVTVHNVIHWLDKK